MRNNVYFGQFRTLRRGTRCSFFAKVVCGRRKKLKIPSSPALLRSGEGGAHDHAIPSTVRLAVGNHLVRIAEELGDFALVEHLSHEIILVEARDARGPFRVRVETAAQLEEVEPGSATCRVDEVELRGRALPGARARGSTTHLATCHLLDASEPRLGQVRMNQE